MPKTLSVKNVTSGKRLKFRQAERLVDEDRICAWVEKPYTIRTLNLAEQMAAHNEAARLRAPLEYAELPGLRFDHPAARVEAMAAAMATRFAAECAL